MAVQSYCKCLTIILSFIFIIPYSVFAEKVKPLNPDCDVCPVVIAYEGDEAKNILGEKIKQQILKLSKMQKKVLKIDLDGIKPVGSEHDNNKGYELIVYTYPHLISISTVQDSSNIKIQTDYQSLKSNMDINKWSPKIELMPSNDLAIDREDSLETAWSKMRLSIIYSYINNNIDHRKWDNAFKKFLGNIISLATDQ